MSTLTLGGSTLASKSGSVLSLDSGVTFPSGKIINFGVLQNSTRVSVSNSSSNDREILDFGDYNKLYASSNLAIHVFLVTESHDAAGAVNIGLKYGSGATQFSGSYPMPANTYIGLSGAYYYLTGHTTTGAQAVSFRSGTQQSSATKPFQIINPNATDDNRLAQTISTAFIYEIQP